MRERFDDLSRVLSKNQSLYSAQITQDNTVKHQNVGQDILTPFRSNIATQKKENTKQTQGVFSAKSKKRKLDEILYSIMSKLSKRKNRKVSY